MLIDLQPKKNTKKNVSIICLICLNQKKEEQMFRMATCQHRYCYSCVLKNIRTKLNSFSQIFCPQCQNNIFDSKVTIYQQLDDKDKNIIQKIKKYNQILKNPQLRLCTDAKCKGFIKFDYNENGTSNCSECKKKFCNKCYDKEHEGIKCEEEIINKMNKLHYKRCQNCKRFIQRIQGCEHIICTCGNQFCYACGQKWNGDHVCLQNLDQIPLQQQSHLIINTHSIIRSLSHTIVEIQEQYSDIIVSENQPTVNFPPQGQIRKANPRSQIIEYKVAQKQQKGSIDKQISSKHDTNQLTIQRTNNIRSMNGQKLQREAIDIKTEIRTSQPYYRSEGAAYMNKYLSSHNPTEQTIINIANIRAANLQTQKIQQLSFFAKTQQSMNQGPLKDRFIGYNSKQFLNFWTHQNLKIKLILSIIYLILYPFILIIYTLYLIIGYILLQLWLFSPIIYIYEKIFSNQDSKQFETTTQDLIIFFLIILFYPLSATFLFLYQISSCYCPHNQRANAYTCANIQNKKKNVNKDFYSPCQKFFYSMFFMLMSPCLILSK